MPTPDQSHSVVESLTNVQGEIEFIRNIGLGDTDALGTLHLWLVLAAERVENYRTAVLAEKSGK